MQETWWRQEATEQQLEATLKNISSEAGERRQREYDRCGGGKGGEGELVLSSDG